MSARHATTDCRSEIGVRVGILDAILTLCRCLPRGRLTNPAVEEAFRDVAGDEDFAYLLCAVAAMGNVPEWKVRQLLCEIRDGIAAEGVGTPPECRCRSTDAYECEEQKHRERNAGRNPEFPVEPCLCSCHAEAPLEDAGDPPPAP